MNSANAPDALAEALALYPAAVRRPLADRVKTWAFWAAGLGVLIWFAIDLDLTPQAFGRGFEVLGRFMSAMWPPTDGGDTARILTALAQTFAMAFAGTAIAAFIAVPLGFFAAKTMSPHPVFHFALRRTLDIFRGVPALVWALILVTAFGLGPFAGVMALALADIPRLAKLYAEAIENVEERQRDALRAAGAGPLTVFRYATVPQAGPVWMSQCLYMLEQNFRNAAILGIVGAGGIGFELEERIRVFQFDEVAFIVILYIICVSILDWISEKLRARLA